MLDIKRCAVYTNLGIMKLATTAGNFEAGTALQKVLEAGETKLTISDGTNPCGIAKWDHMSGIEGLVVREAVTFPVCGGVNITATVKHANLIAAMYKVEALAGGDYTEGGASDYTMDATHGIVTREFGTTTIPDGGTVYVTYKYQKTDAEIDAGEYPYGLIGGRNIRNSLDDVSGSGRMTLIQGFAILFTTVYDTSLDYTLGQKLYSNATGKITNVAGGHPVIGTVHAVPTASDVFLGVELHGFTPGI